MRAFPLSAVAATLAIGCSTPSADIPSLAPRAAEQVDPRLPVERPPNDRPVDAGLAARLAALVQQARSGETGFDAAISAARQAAAAAGPPQSESWIVAQEALSAAVAAREPAAMAVAEIDSIGAELLVAQGGLAPADLAAIESAAEIAGSITRRQAEAVAAVQARLGS